MAFSASPGKHGINKSAALDLAVDALTFIAADPARFAGFLSVSGYHADDIRAQAASPDFMAGVLDFLLGDESMLLVFCSHHRHDPADIHAARQTLSPDAYEKSI